MYNVNIVYIVIGRRLIRFKKKRRQRSYEIDRDILGAINVGLRLKLKLKIKCGSEAESGTKTKAVNLKMRLDFNKNKKNTRENIDKKLLNCYIKLLNSS